VEKNKWEFEINAIYVIAILDFVFDEDKDNLKKYRYDVKLTDIETHKVFYDKLTFIYLEMPKFNKNVDELNTRFEKWLYVIKNLWYLDDIPDRLREHIFEKMFAAAEVAKLNKQEYMRYVEFRKHARDIHNSITFAFEEGEVKGFKKGLKKGEEKGRVEEKIQLTISSFQAGLPIETIATITGLTTEKIIEIVKQNRLL
jgi:predicted transposase/invertase (TIGR01784 family)